MSIASTVQQLLGSAARSEISTAEAAGLANAVASVSVSFDSGLLPRTLPEQAVLTGLWSGLTYGLTATTQSFIESGINRLGLSRLHSPASRRAAILAADSAAVAIGIALQKALPARPDEPLIRAGGRAAGWRLTLSAVSGVTALTVDGIHDTFTKTHEEQSVNTLATVLGGSAVAGVMYLWRQRRLIDTGVETDQFGQDVGKTVRWQPLAAAAIGPGVTTGLFLMSRGERWAARTIGQAVAKAAPSTAPYATAIGHGVALGGMFFASGRAISAVYHKTEQAGEAIEEAYSQVPDSPYVSGGSAASKEDWETFGREGRRYVNMAMTAAEIEAVIKRPAMNPIRAYVGLGSEISPSRRAARAMTELQVLGAFDRDYIAVFFPTGTGYVNYVALESLEYLTGGNVASVAIQYSVRPSFLSLGEVGTARESNLLLLSRLAERIRTLPAERRPKILLFGESLGSLGGQDVLEPEGTDDLDVLQVHRALFIGTPFTSRWRQRWLATPEVVDPEGIVVEVQGIDEWRALPDVRRDRARVVLLTHNNDPIPKFGAPLIIQEPEWMGPPDTRPPGVPRHTIFIPVLTFLLTAIDLLQADHVVPGKFEANAHDYRKDLAEMVRAAFALAASDEEMADVEAALRRRELAWAERRLLSAELRMAEKQIRDKFDRWGIDSSAVPGFVEAKRLVEADPYAAIDTSPSL